MSEQSVQLSQDAIDEATVRAHALSLLWWNERKISAEYTSDDERNLANMLRGYLTWYLIAQQGGDNGVQNGQAQGQG